MTGLAFSPPMPQYQRTQRLLASKKTGHTQSLKEGFFTSSSFGEDSPVLDPHKFLGIIPSLKHSPLNALKHPQTPEHQSLSYPLTFSDSGLGGLLFMLDAVREINSDLRTLESNYRVSFSATHIGAANWAPFGNKSFELIQSHTLSLIKESAKRGAHIATIACNTASVTLNEAALLWAKEFAPHVSVVPIVKPTAKILYDAAKEIETETGIEKHIAILATPATTRSQQYPEELAIQHALLYGDDALTVVINPIENRPLMPDHTDWVAYFRGKVALSSENPEAIELTTQLQIGSRVSSHPVLYVYTYAPPNWVSILEGKMKANFEEEVSKDIDHLLTQIGTHKARLSVIGTCCTHYPAAIPIINRLLSAQGLTTEVMSQGAKIGREVILKMIQWEASQSLLESRTSPDPVSNSPIPLRSDTAVDQSEPVDPLPGLKAVAGSLFPDLHPQIIYKTIASLPSPYLG